MKKSMIVLFTITTILAGGAAFLFLSGEGDAEPEMENPRELASTLAEYDAMAACDKQAALWRQIKSTEYKSLPDFKSFSVPELWELSRQAIVTKKNHHSDYAPKGWKKLLHARGAIAKIKIVPVGGNYTGIFQGADCGLLRLSITFKPSLTRGVAPGLALKILRDKTSSANVSALVSLAGQGKDYNFFRFPLSNIVPVGTGFGQKIVHSIFNKVTAYPEELAVNDMATIDTKGVRAASVVSPRQIFFVPAGLTFSSEDHDVRTDFLKIPAGTVVYRVLAAPASRASFDYGKYSADDVAAFVKESQHIADIETTSEFAASQFGDSGIFFRHEIR